MSWSRESRAERPGRVKVEVDEGLRNARNKLRRTDMKALMRGSNERNLPEECKAFKTVSK